MNNQQTNYVVHYRKKRSAGRNPPFNKPYKGTSEEVYVPTRYDPNNRGVGISERLQGLVTMSTQGAVHMSPAEARAVAELLKTFADKIEPKLAPVEDDMVDTHLADLDDIDKVLDDGES